MSYYAKVLNGKVVNVISAEEDFFKTFVDSSPGNWIKTSYNTRGGIHYGQDGQPDGGIPLRANFAGIGYNYDQTNDVFYAQQPFPSWILNTATWLWESPVPYQTDKTEICYWDETIKNWVEIVK
jgi:hypothetical protein